MTRLPPDVIDLVRAISAQRDAQRRMDGNEIRKLTAVIDTCLASVLPRLEAGGGAKITDAQDALIALAEEAAACLSAQRRYFAKKEHQLLCECKDRERRLTQRCRDVLANRPKPPGLFETYEAMKAGAA